MPAKWRVNDLMDLEYFLTPQGGDRPENPSTGKISSDRRLYLAYAGSHTPPFSRQDLIKFWLEEHQKNRRKESSGTLALPGDAYRESMSLARTLLIIAAALAGAALSWSLLSYSGTAPINIFTCIWVLLIPQLLLLAVLGVSLLFSRVGVGPAFKGLYPLLIALFRRLIRSVKRVGEISLTGDQRIGIHAVAGLIGRQKSLYGPVFFWPIFMLAQIFAVFFNLGILGATLIKLAITDLAFGWQSTLHPTPETVFRLVDWFSMPWSWLPGAHPTLAQIQGSQMILKDGMVHLFTPNLISWWPFLCYAILFYGLMPRLILLAIGIYQQTRALKRISFSTSACDRLIHRMQFPQVQSIGRSYAPFRSSGPLPGPMDQPEVMPESHLSIDAPPAIVLIPEDITELFHNPQLTERIAEVLGLTLNGRIFITMDPETDMKIITAALSQDGLNLSVIRIVVLMEAWQPPIRETMGWISQLRKIAGPGTGIIIALTGKPGKQKFLTPAAGTDRMIWERAINGLGDPFIRIENMGGV